MASLFCQKPQNQEGEGKGHPAGRLSVGAVASVAKGVGIKQHPYQARGGHNGENALAGVAAAKNPEHIKAAVDTLTIEIKAGYASLGETEAKNHQPHQPQG